MKRDLELLEKILSSNKIIKTKEDVAFKKLITVVILLDVFFAFGFVYYTLEKNLLSSIICGLPLIYSLLVIWILRSGRKKLSDFFVFELVTDEDKSALNNNLSFNSQQKLKTICANFCDSEEANTYYPLFLLLFEIKKELGQSVT